MRMLRKGTVGAHDMPGPADADASFHFRCTVCVCVCVCVCVLQKKQPPTVGPRRFEPSWSTSISNHVLSMAHSLSKRRRKGSASKMPHPTPPLWVLGFMVWQEKKERKRQ
jgi:hypothetical protein